MLKRRLALSGGWRAWSGALMVLAITALLAVLNTSVAALVHLLGAVRAPRAAPDRFDRRSPDPNRRFISCTDQLTSRGSAIGGAQITLTYQRPGPGSATSDIATTAADGSFRDTINAPPGSLLASGDWSVTAHYSGDSTQAPVSDTQSVTVR